MAVVTDTVSVGCSDWRGEGGLKAVVTDTVSGLMAVVTDTVSVACRL